jgi:hypothetical protein
MAIGLSDILSAMQNGVTAIRALQNQLALVFPQATASSTIGSTVAGTITFTSSQAVAFLSVTTSSGGVYKVPLY